MAEVTGTYRASANRTMVDGEDHRLAPAQRHDLASGLRARPLLDQQELAAVKSTPGRLSNTVTCSGNTRSP